MTIGIDLGDVRIGSGLVGCGGAFLAEFGVPCV